MLESNIFQVPPRRRKNRGQALVEFALTVLVFLLLLVMIIEVGRILWTYVTLQHAAKTGARYAVTGRWLEEYAADTDLHFDTASDDPLNHIFPCYPLFYDDSIHGFEAFVEQGAWEFYQPFRSPRTCSVERVSLDQMMLLPLDVNAQSDDPGYYEIVVSGYTTDMYPTTGTFTRPCSLGDAGCTGGEEELPYSAYFTEAVHVGDNPGLARGFAGTPQQKVVVQVRYRLPIITPILSAIAPSIRLNGTATMVNEAWGSTGNNREAILPPPFVEDLEDLGDTRPPNLVVDEVRINTPGPGTNPDAPPDRMILIGDPAEFEADISNTGGFDVDRNESFDVTLYAHELNDKADPTPLTDSGFIELATVTMSSPDGTASTLARDETRTVTFSNVDLTPTNGGTYYFYVWADSGNVIDEEGSGEDTFPAQEQDNANVTSESVLVKTDYEIEVFTDFYAPDGGTTAVSYPAPGDQVDYVVTIRNVGTATSPDLWFEDYLPAGLTFVSQEAGDGTYNSGADRWEQNPVAPGETTVRLRVEVSGSAGDVISAWSGAISEAGGPGVTYTMIHDDTLFVGGLDIGVEVDVELLSPTQIQVVIDATNNGPNDATGVVIQNTLSEPGAVPSWTVTGDGSYDTGTHTWTVDVNNGATASVTLTGDLDYGGFTFTSDVALDTGAMTQPDTVGANNTATDSEPVPGAELAVTLTRISEFAVPGQPFIFQARVTNTNGDPIDGVEVEITYPAGVTPTGTEIWSVGSMATGGDRTRNFTVTIAAVPPDPLNFDAEIIAYDGLLAKDWGAENLTDRLTVSPSEPTVDLTVNKSVTVEGSGNPYDGEALIYNIRVTNNDTLTAEGVTLVDNLPTAYLTNVTVQANTGDAYDGTTWTVGDLAPGDAATLTLRAVINAPGGTVITNTITDADLDATNAVAQIASDSNPSASITVEVNVDLSLLLTADGDQTPDDSYVIGETIDFTIAVANTGIADATGVSATLVAPLGGLPSGLSFQSIGTPSHGSVNFGTGLWEIGTLPGGETATLDFVANVDSVPGGGFEGDINVRAEVHTTNEADADSTPGNYSGGSPSEDDEDIITVSVAVPRAPMPLWVNLGTPTSTCPATNWGGPTDSALAGLPQTLSGSAPTWRRNQPYDASDGWGYSGGSRLSNEQRFDYPNGSQDTDDTTQSFFECRTEGAFTFRMDGLEAGQYRIYLAVADYNYSALETFIFWSYVGRSFDIQYRIENGGLNYLTTESDNQNLNEYNIASEAGGRYRVHVETSILTLGADASYVTLDFNNGEPSGFFSNLTNTNPLIQGVGIEKIN